MGHFVETVHELGAESDLPRLQTEAAESDVADEAAAYLRELAGESSAVAKQLESLTTCECPTEAPRKRCEEKETCDSVTAVKGGPVLMIPARRTGGGYLSYYCRLLLDVTEPGFGKGIFLWVLSGLMVVFLLAYTSSFID